MRSDWTTRIALCLAAATLAAGCAQLESLPKLTNADLRLELAQSSMVFSGDGRLITTLHGEENRTIVTSLDKVPDHVEDAVIAIEDERFHEHDGIDLRAIVRAAVRNMASGEIEEGGSTITQQYVKNVIIAPGETAARTLERKINEAALARQIELRMSKDEILLNYLNTVYFGNGAYGIQAAAKTYFGKPARKVSLGEGALLAALIKAPGSYDPFTRRRTARARRNVVLDKMARLGWVEQAAVERAKRKGLRLDPAENANRYPAPYFVDYVQRLIKYDPHREFRKVGSTFRQRERALFQGGLRIHTTIDLDAQAAAEAAVAQVLPNANDPHASLVAIEPDTGYVRAMVGGRDWFAPRRRDPFAKLNLAIMAEPGLGRIRDPATGELVARAPGTGRQAGSAFKPFALAAAIAEGIPLSKTYDARACMDFSGANAGGNWRVCNYAESGFGNRFTLLEATVFSVNVVYAQLILEVGPEAAVELADRMGINTNLSAVPAAVLGSNAVNPLGMASAYATLANNGEHHPPVAITRVTDAAGNVLYRSQTEPQSVLEPAAAFLTTTALQQVIRRGTAASYGNIGRPVAGKTGTAQEYRDAWFAGYTPDLATAVWIGYPEDEIEMKTSCAPGSACRPTRINVTGGSWPTQIWSLFMTRALAGLPATAFEVPNVRMVTVTIDSRTGCLVDRFTPQEFRTQALLPAAAAPTESCPVPGDAVKVPNVFGFPVRDAVRILEEAGFVVERVETETTTYPPGRVVGQKPAAGKKTPKGASVVIEVSVRPADEPTEEKVPNVLGMTRAAAEAALTDAGFDVEVVVEPESDRNKAKERAGRVWKQAPPGGAEAEAGETVTIWVNPDR